MSKYGISHDSDGWWSVRRGFGGYFIDDFLTREEAEAAVERFECEDIEAEREAREQDLAADRGDWEFHRDHDQSDSPENF